MSYLLLTIGLHRLERLRQLVIRERLAEILEHLRHVSGAHELRLCERGPAFENTKRTPLLWMSKTENASAASSVVVDVYMHVNSHR